MPSMCHRAQRLLRTPTVACVMVRASPGLLAVSATRRASSSKPCRCRPMPTRTAANFTTVKCPESLRTDMTMKSALDSVACQALALCLMPTASQLRRSREADRSIVMLNPSSPERRAQRACPSSGICDKSLTKSSCNVSAK